MHDLHVPVFVSVNVIFDERFREDSIFTKLRIMLSQ